MEARGRGKVCIILSFFFTYDFSSCCGCLFSSISFPRRGCSDSHREMPGYVRHLTQANPSLSSTAQDASQKNLSNWTNEEWQTKEGSGHAKQSDGTQKRYLPKKAWEQMNEDEKQETDEKKVEEGKEEGKQFVGNTGRAKGARKEAVNGEDNDNHHDDKGGKRKAKSKNQEPSQPEPKQQKGTRSSTRNKSSSTSTSNSKSDIKKSNQGPNEAEDKPSKPSTNGTKKRSAPSTSSPTSNKKSKNTNTSDSSTIGSKHDAPDAPQGTSAGSSTRLPKEGQRVSWKALPGWCHGTCVEVVREAKEVRGKMVKGKEDDPRIVLEADSGKIAGHKPDSCYF